MTKHRFLTVRPLAAALVLVLALPLTAVQAQLARPSATPRLAAPAAPAANAAPRAGAQRQADFIVVVVNSEPITNNEVRTKLLRTEQQLKQQGIALPPRSELMPQLLERMISDKAQLQAAQATGFKIDDNAVEGAVQTVARQNQVTVDELRRRLKADGIDYAQFRSEIRDELLISRLRQREVESRINVSEMEIDDYLRSQEGKPGAASAAPAALNLAEILVAVPENATPDQVASLQAKAQQVLERARAGADFAALAAEVSASASRSNGGQMGLRSADRYPPLFVEATQSLRCGRPGRPGAQRRRLSHPEGDREAAGRFARCGHHANPCPPHPAAADAAAHRSRRHRKTGRLQEAHRGRPGRLCRPGARKQPGRLGQAGRRPGLGRLAALSCRNLKRS